MADPNADTGDPSDYLASRQMGPIPQAVDEPPSAKKRLSPQSTDISQGPSYFEPPPQLKQYDVRPPSQQQFDNPFAVFQNPMILMAGLSSLLTRQPLTTAMNAAAGAMKGFHEGQQDVFNRQKEIFNENLATAVEQNKVELNRYNAAWDRKKELDWQRVYPQLRSQAVANQDQLMVAALDSHNWPLVEKILVGRESAMNHVQMAIDTQNARVQAQEQEIEMLKKDPGVIAQADAIRNYDQPPLPQGRPNPRNQAIQELVTEKSAASGEPYQATGYGAKSKFVTGLGSTTTGSPGGQVNSAKIVIQHLATLDQLIDDLGSGNTARFRRAAQAVQTEFGLSSAPTNFDAAVGLVAGEIVKLVEGSGGTGEDRARITNSFNRANSAPLLHDAVDVAREVMSARVGALADQAKAVRAEGQFNRFLPPETQGMLKPRRKGFDVEAFKKKAKDAGYTDSQIDAFLAEKGH